MIKRSYEELLANIRRETAEGISRMEEKAREIHKRLDRKIEILEAIEHSVDARIAMYERLMQMSESMNIQQNTPNRKTEVMALFERGMSIDEIADVLGMQGGEVELILNLYA